MLYIYLVRSSGSDRVCGVAFHSQSVTEREHMSRAASLHLIVRAPSRFTPAFPNEAFMKVVIRSIVIRAPPRSTDK